MGDGSQLGVTDKNIENGISVDVAADDLAKGIYLRRSQLILGGLFHQIAPKILSLSETLLCLVGGREAASQRKARDSAMKNE